MTAHAKLSASGASRWLNCPGSVKAEELFPDKSSIYAEEGTLAHEMAELKLSKWIVKGFGPKKFKTAMDKLKENDLYSPEMNGFTDEYVDYIKEVVLSYDVSPLTVIEEKVDLSAYVPEGFGTADCVVIGGNHLQIIDLKYGKGVEVSAESNTQLMLYALGVWSTYSFIYPEIETVTLHIVQPRLNNFSKWSLSLTELLEFGEYVKPIALEAFNGSDKFKAGSHCKFCKAKGLCKERAAEYRSIAEEVKPIFENSALPLLSPAEVGNLLKLCEGLSDYISDLEDEALILCLDGKDVPGYKAVEGRSNRAFKDIDQAFSVLMSNGVDKALLYERKPLSLSKIEKLIGKKEFNSMLADEVVKPPGKPTLVKDSDKREAINLASRMFNNLGGN